MQIYMIILNYHTARIFYAATNVFLYAEKNYADSKRLRRLLAEP